ncbi:hypothetical protein PMN64_37905, partial [Bradyrhizobium sp. UFLA01-814]|uniref:hypothetical protein n=1 Tax=Bradyrhizobium sp. UFLA01-814 TaxID=3023480 RepID=UPI00398B901A
PKSIDVHRQSGRHLQIPAATSSLPAMSLILTIARLNSTNMEIVRLRQCACNKGVDRGWRQCGPDKSSAHSLTDRYA